jgi:hypothetical protein
MLAITPNEVMANESSQERVIDLVQVSWPGAPEPTENLISVKLNLESKSIQFWNQQLSMSPRNLKLKMGLSDTTLIQMANPPNCDGVSVTRYIESIKLVFGSRFPSVKMQDRYLVILIPRIKCVWEAISTLNEVGSWKGGMILNNVSKSFVISHELGHALGIGHSNLVACEAGKFDGVWLKECRGIEYGGAVDLMSNIEVSTPLSTYHKWRLGLIPDSDIKQTWLDETITLNDSDSAWGKRAIFLRVPGASYWIEYRKRSFNNLDKPGLVVYRIDPPPTRAIISPNVDDLTISESDARVSTEVWMLNLDDFRYLDGSASGSMTLPPGKSFSTFSGNVTLKFEQLNAESVSIKITRNADLGMPPTPEFSPEDQWTSPQSSILKLGANYEDADSVIHRFEVEQNSVVTSISSPAPGFIPTYISPLTAPKTILLGDLQEGNYSIRVRAVDIWGNKSNWSESKKVNIDKSFPIVKNEFYALQSSKGSSKLELSGATDAGSGVCLVRILNSDGFVLARSSKVNATFMDLHASPKIKGVLQVFDCKGNGLEGKVDIEEIQADFSKMKKTGKWNSLFDSSKGDSLNCLGKCTISFSLRNASTIFAASGKGEIFINGKKYSNFGVDKKTEPIVIFRNNFGNRSSTVRISGFNLEIFRPISIKSSLGPTKEIFQKAVTAEAPIEDIEQKNLSLFGFSKEDFDENWSVIPIAKGTTLESPTLDFCFDKFDSESNRIARRQLMANRESSPYLFVSTEVVRYKSKLAGIEAQNELKVRIEDCVRNGGFRNADGVFESYLFLPLEGTQEKYRIVDNGILLHVKIGIDNSARYLLAYYQFNNGVLSGMYVVKPSQSAFTMEELAKWEQVRSKLSFRLISKSKV